MLRRSVRECDTSQNRMPFAFIRRRFSWHENCERKCKIAPSSKASWQLTARLDRPGNSNWTRDLDDGTLHGVAQAEGK